MAGEIQATTFWTATVAGLGSENPDSVAFTKSSNFPTTWEEVTVNFNVFIKFPKVYRKINTIEDNQITSFTISNLKLDNDYRIYPCFIDENGRELDYILIGKYMSNSDQDCNSLNGVNAKFQTISNGRTNARSKGDGYQLMDWRIQRLCQDLVICAYGKININSGSGITTDKLGIYWGGATQWIDGFCCDDTMWLYSNNPSTFINAPIAGQNNYISATCTVSTRGNIKSLGYDESEPFLNYPSAIVDNADFNTYYCDGYFYSSGPMRCYVGGNTNYLGPFNCDFDGWNNTNAAVRLCYRPLAPTLETGTYAFKETPTLPMSAITPNFSSITSIKTYALTADNTYATEAVPLSETSGTYNFTPTAIEYTTSYGKNHYSQINNVWKWTTFAYDTATGSVKDYTATDTTKLRTWIIETDITVSADFYKWAITDGNLIKQSFYQFKHFYQKDLVGSGSYQFRQFTPTALPDKLATPQNVAAAGTTVSWDAVENAESYDVYADDTVLLGNTTGGTN